MTIQKLLDGAQVIVKEHGMLTFVLVYLLLNVIEVSPIKVSPLTWAFKGLRKALIGSLEARVTAMEAKNDLEFAKIARARVQRFADECYNDVHHSQQHFEQILDDVKAYETYCDSHKGFKNHKTGEAISIIEDTYHKCFEKHSFL